MEESTRMPPKLEETLAALRQEYGRAGLSERDVDPDPIAQLERWMGDALSSGVYEANAATLATASRDGAPNARVVLIKGIDARGVTFFTNYESTKGRELAANPRACIVVHWRELERQVRVAGRVEKVARAESEAYFQSRPRGSQLGAWASAQSEVVASREALDAKLADVAARFGEGEIPTPERWGGYRLAPETVELWQGRPNRMHDRIRYRQAGSGWVVERLSP
jgi:pyridoxamine 5'-phosphate oxidase